MRARLALLSCVLLVWGPSPAESTPIFDLYVSTGGVTHLGVGETLALRAYLPKVKRGREMPPVPLRAGIQWKVEPEGFASVTDEGLLTALRPGRIRIHVEAVATPKGELPPGSPGSASLEIVKDLADGRLPRLSGMKDFERFTVEWDRSGYDGNKGLTVGLETFPWRLWVTTKAPPDGPFPWVLETVPARSHFDDYAGYQDLLSADDYERWRRNLTSARLTLTSWKDGLVAGRLELTTSRGVSVDTTFHARMEDRGGALARAATPPPAPVPRAPR